MRPHAPTHIGERTYRYDANGNQTGWDHDQNGTRRNIVWDDEDQIQSIFDNGHEKTYKYDDKGDRAIKRGPQGETVYVNQFFTDRPGSNGTKHVYAGTSRIASKLMRQDAPNSNPHGNTPFEKDLYFYHPDHLGSSNFITDLNGKLYEHLEYFPYGESWVEENSNAQRTPYLFSGKELDEETGLYYFGARYYDPRTSVWQSADPILAELLDDRVVELTRKLGVYGYVENRPINHVDPDGKDSYQLIWLPVRGEIGHAAFATDLYKKTVDSSGKVTYSETGKVRIMELWPAGSVGKSNARRDVEADYNVGQVIDKKDLLNYKGGENRPAEGVLQINTGPTVDKKAEVAEKVLGEMKAHRDANPKYNGEKNNCADYCVPGLRASGVKIGDKDRATALGGLLGADVRTPNKLWRDTAKQPGVKILRDPGPKVNEKYEF